MTKEFDTRTTEQKNNDSLKEFQAMDTATLEETHDQAQKSYVAAATKNQNTIGDIAAEEFKAHKDRVLARSFLNNSKANQI